MSTSVVLEALALPDESRVNRRVPKKLLTEQGAPTAADKRQIQDGVDEIVWAAALKPTNIGVPIFRDELREYLEIAVVIAVLRANGKLGRLLELVHRAIPYPVVLVTAQGRLLNVSFAHKRWSQGEAGKTVIEGLHRTAPFQPDAPTSEESLFLQSLALSQLPHRDLFVLYEGWIDRVSALQVAQITGSFALPDSADRGSALRGALDVRAEVQRQIVLLRAQAAKEKQLNRRVQLNLEIKRLEGKLAGATDTLRADHSR